MSLSEELKHEPRLRAQIHGLVNSSLAIKDSKHLMEVRIDGGIKQQQRFRIFIVSNA